MTAGARVDVLVTTEERTRLALEDVEVLAARATSSEHGPRVVATLRVGVSDAVYLVAAQSFAEDVAAAWLGRPEDDREAWVRWSWTKGSDRANGGQ